MVYKKTFVTEFHLNFIFRLDNGFAICVPIYLKGKVGLKDFIVSIQLVDFYIPW
jgi:hypothetical protein